MERAWSRFNESAREGRLLKKADAAYVKAEKDFRRSLKSAKARNGMGTLYFIATQYEQEIKIGWTGQSPYQRLHNLQTGQPAELKLLLALAGTKEEERLLHIHFSYALCREGCRSEWFMLSEELVVLFRLLNGHPIEKRHQDIAANLRLGFAWLLSRPTYQQMEREACHRAMKYL